MNKVILAARVLLSLILLFFGINGFFHFLPHPPPVPLADSVLDFMRQNKHLMDLVIVSHILFGGLLLINRFVPLVLALQLSVSINIVLFHLAVDPERAFLGYLVGALNVFLLFTYRADFKDLFRSR